MERGGERREEAKGEGEEGGREREKERAISRRR